MINTLRIFMIGFILSVGMMLISQIQPMQSWSCTSFVINKTGYIGTAGHCVKGATNLSVIMKGGVYDAKLIDADFEKDVAIIKINKRTLDYFRIEFGPKADNTVYILGYPIPDMRGYDLKSRMAGVIYTEKDYYRTGGGTCSGNSGGPVVNSNNNVIGVLVAGYGAPCSYYNEVSKIEGIVELALKHNIWIDINQDEHPRLMNQIDAREFNLNKTPILIGGSE